MNNLTRVFIEAISEPGEYPDGDGLYLVVKRNVAGALDNKSWMFRYKRNGKSRKPGLGAYPELSIANARRVARQYRELLAQGIDPMEHRDKQREEANARAVTFRQAAETCRDEYFCKRWRSAETRRGWDWRMEKNVYPVIGDIRVSEINKTHLEKVLKLGRFMENNRTLYDDMATTAQEIRVAIYNILNFSCSRGWRLSSIENPADHKLFKYHHPQKTTHKKKGRPALPHEQIGAFMEHLRKLGKTRGNSSTSMRPTVAACLEFQILTAARPGEARNATWNEIDFERRVWSIPAAKMKMDHDHDVPLSDAAVAVLERQKGQHFEFIFPGRKPYLPLSDAPMKQLLDSMGYKDKKGEPIVPHGFRSTFMDWGRVTTDYKTELLQLAIAHQADGYSESDLHYARDKLTENRRPLMQHWANVCNTPRPQEGDVIPLFSKRA